MGKHDTSRGQGSLDHRHVYRMQSGLCQFYFCGQFCEGVDTGGGSGGGGDALLDGDSTWTGDNTFNNPVTIGDSTAATEDWTLNNAIGVITGNTSVVYQDGITSTNAETHIEIEETEFSAWWFIRGQQQGS